MNIDVWRSEQANRACSARSRTTCRLTVNERGSEWLFTVKNGARKSTRLFATKANHEKREKNQNSNTKTDFEVN